VERERLTAPDYLPRNDNVVVRAAGGRYVVEAVGRMVEDLRPGDFVTLPDFEGDEEGGAGGCFQLDEEGGLFIVREYLVLAIERPAPGVKDAYEDFNS
jgi:hypothetical protein